uniref:F-box domain-containing protein n=2 Tax=Physcomitrium patens TaxID=3218 RepID=A0A2K1JX82_PHYPA|nr:hypothetical protein PHYPA_013261 [Physcomitrium patens]
MWQVKEVFRNSGRRYTSPVNINPREDGGSTGVPISNVVDQQEYTSMRGKSPQECLSLLNVMPLEVMDYILAFAPSSILFQVRGVCKVFSTFISRRTFLQARAELRPFECPLSPLSFIVEKGKWQVVGLNYQAHLMEDQKVWEKLPPFTFASPDPDLFKGFLVAGHGGLICAEVGNSDGPDKLVLYNPLTMKTLLLPSLIAPRHPVALSLHVTRSTKRDTYIPSFRVIAVGSAANGTERLSRKTEVYDSAEGKWKVAGDVPGADFSINEYQTGVFCESLNLLLCVGFMIDGRKGILAFDVVQCRWRENWVCPLHELPADNEAPTFVHFSIAVLVECSGVIYLFSEHERNKKVSHCIDRLDLDSAGGYTWTRKVTRERQRNQALLVYPEFTCVPLKDHKLCIFNTIERSGVVYDMQDDPIDPSKYEALPAPPALGNKTLFHSLNPITYAFEPSFVVDLPEN